MKLLIVDDEKLIRQGIRFILEGSGLSFKEIYEAENGRAAISMAQQHRPEIILMDIKMPGLDGISAAREISHLITGCKIIFLTAYDSFEYAREALRCKARDFLVKPVSRKELIKTFKACIDEINQDFVSIISPASGEPWFTPDCPPNVCIVIKVDCQLTAGIVKNTRTIKTGNVSYPIIMVQDGDRIICLTRVFATGSEAISATTDVARALAGVLCGPDGAGFKAGIGNICSHTHDLRQSYAEASRAFEQAPAYSAEAHGAEIIHIGSLDEKRIISRPYQLVQQAIKYIEKNYNKKVHLEELARHLYLSPVYLSTIIRQYTGYTFSDYITFVRMENAKKMLASSLSVKEVAMAVGYSDSNYFCRVFKKVTGVTATSFRKRGG